MTAFDTKTGPKFAVRIKEGFIKFGDYLIVGELGDFDDSPPTLFSSREEAEEKAADLDADDEPSIVQVGYFTTFEEPYYEVDKYFPTQAGPFKAGFQGRKSAHYISDGDAQDAADEKNQEAGLDNNSEWYYAVKEVVPEDETTELAEMEVEEADELQLVFNFGEGEA